MATSPPYGVYCFPQVVSGDTARAVEFRAVQADLPEVVSGTDIAFTAPDTITSTTSDLSVYVAGELVTVTGSTSNDGTYTVTGTPTVSSLQVVEQTLTTEVAGSTISISAPTPIDLTGASILMELRVEAADDPPAYTLSTANTRIAITNALAGIFEVVEQTIAIDPETYTYQLQVTLADASVSTWLEGQWKVLQDYARG